MDERPGTLPVNPNSLSSSSTVGNVRPVLNGDPNTVGPYQSLPGCKPANVVDGFCAWDYKDYQNIQPKTERLNVFARGAYNFTDTLQAYTELSWFQSKVSALTFPDNTNSVSYNQLTGEIITTPTLTMPVGNPANPFNSTNQAARLRYIFGELDTTQSYTTDTQRYLVGLKGSNYDWDWDAALLYVGATTDATMRGFVNRPNLLAALNGQGGFGYFQPGVAGVNNNPGVYGFIAPNLSYTAKSNVTQVDLKASRDLTSMQGGAMALALGAGYRHEYLNNPGWGNIDGSIMNLGYNTISGSRNVYDFYAELFMPIFKNLEVTAAVRYDNYSDTGGTTNPLIQAKWVVVPELFVRGTFATGFRAPNPAEIASSATTGFTSFVDPVRCPVTDAPADCGASNLAVISIGNANLKPETSNTWTAGFVFEPAPWFSGSLDYWYIKTKNQILAPDPQAILNNPEAFPGTTIVRDPTTATPDLPGQVQAVFGPYTNIASVMTDGIDLDAIFRYNTTNAGRYTAEVQWTHIFNFKRTLGGETIQYVDSHGPTSLSSSAGMPQDRVNVILGWTMGPWAATGTVRYVAPIPQTESRGISDSNPCLQDITQPSCKAPSFTTLDLAAQYTGFKNWTIYGSIINVFNRLAPFDPQAGYQIYNYNFNYAQSGAVGTQFNIGAKYVWDAPPQKVAEVAPVPAPVVQPAPPPAPRPAAPPPPPPPAPQVQRITLDSKALFDFDKADLKPEGKAAIDSQIVGKIAQVQKLEVVLVTGHTDRLGSEAYNQKLSERRANVVRDYLVSKGVDKAKIETIGMGEKQPVVQCDQKGMKALIECLQPNRRVEVQVKGEATK